MDDILRDYAPFSYYQKRLTALCALATLAISPQAAIVVFIMDQPQWWCAGSDESKRSVDPATLASSSAHANASQNASTLGGVAMSLDKRCELFHSGRCSPVFPHPDAMASAEFGLICVHSTDGKYAQSLFFVGMLLGSLLAGGISDKYGRRTATLIAYVMSVCGSAWTGLAGSFWSFAVARCLSGVGAMVHIVASFVLVSESASPHYRGLATTLQCMAFGMGLSLLAIMAYFTRHSWRLLLCILTALQVFFGILLWLWASESPFWLLGNDHHQELKILISRWSKSSSRAVPESRMRSLCSSPGERKSLTSSPNRSQAEAASLSAFISSGLRKFSLSLLFVWFSVCLVYYGLSLNVDGIGGDKYSSFFLISVIEIPALLILIVVLRYTGRKKAMLMTMTLTGLCCCLSTVVSHFSASKTAPARDGLKTLLLVLVILGKFMGSAFFSALYTYTPEVMPTPVRASGLGVCTVVSRIGAVVCPFVIAWNSSWKALPYAIFSILCLVSCLCILRWPETWNCDLPETIQELRLRLAGKTKQSAAQI